MASDTGCFALGQNPRLAFTIKGETIANVFKIVSNIAAELLRSFTSMSKSPS